MKWPWDLFKDVKGFFEAQSEKIWTGFIGVVWDINNQIVIRLDKWSKKILAPIWDRSYDLFLHYGWLDKESVKSLKELKSFPFPFSLLSPFIVLMSVWLSYAKTFMYAVSSDVRRKLNTEYEPEDAPPQSIIPAAFIAPEKTTEIRQIIMNQGFSEEQVDLMFLSMYRLYDEGVIRNLYLRGVLSEQGLYERMRELGYTDTRIKEMVQGWPVIPGVQDLFHLVAKEAFEPDMIEHYKYADEFPEDQVKWLKMQGLSREWALKFWYAHWDTPAITQGFEMLHRQDPDNPDKKIIDLKELDDLFRTIEIPPFWRDKLTKIGFMPYTRVDIRRMHKVGVISDEQLQISYEDLGYDAEHAANMVAFTKKFNTAKDKDLTRSEILKGYSEGLILKEDVTQLLINMGYSEDETGYIVTYEEYKKDKKLQDMMLTNIQSRFEGNLLDEAHTRERLNSLNLSGQHIEILIDKWKINRFEDMKIPSKADLAKLVMYDIITIDVYKEEMFKLGYNPKYIGWYLELEFAIKEAKEAK